MSNKNLANHTREFPTIPLLRGRIKDFQDQEGWALTEVARAAGISYRYLVEICVRPPDSGIKTQKIESILELVDKLAAIGVQISREDICQVILDYPSFAAADAA